MPNNETQSSVTAFSVEANVIPKVDPVALRKTKADFSHLSEETQAQIRKALHAGRKWRIENNAKHLFDGADRASIQKAYDKLFGGINIKTPKVDPTALQKTKADFSHLSEETQAQIRKALHAGLKWRLENNAKHLFDGADRASVQKSYEKLFSGVNSKIFSKDELKERIAKNQELMRSTASHMEKQSMYEKLFANAPKQTAWDTMREAINSVKEGFNNLSQARDSFFEKLSTSIDGATAKLQSFRQPVEDFKSSLSAFGKEIGNNGVFKAFSKIGNFVTTPMKKVVANFKEGIKHATGFFSAIKRIAIYRAIRSALKAITQGFEEGRQNAYQWSVITGNQFARSMDMMATSALYLKNSLGAMTMPLTNYLAPILDRLIDQFVELINIVNRFIATITGASSWVKALKYPAEYMEQAAGSAKELKNQLLGFDDLNVLNAPSGSGSASAMDYSKMFEQVELNMSNMSFTKALQDAIKNSDWVRVGEVLSEQLNMMVESIDAKKISKWLGDKLNNAIRLVHTLLRQIDFQQIGFKIGEFISNLQLDWGRIASSWVLWATNIADTLLGVINGVNWSNVGHAIGEYIKGLFNTFAEWINGVDWEKAIDSLTQAFLDLVRGIDWHGVLSSLLAGFTGILNAFVSSLTAAGNALWKLIKGDMSDYNNAVRTLNGYRPIYAPQGTNTGRQGNAVTGSANSHQHGIQTIDIFANGGFPEQGTMFIAGEQGAEVVSQIGGRTGVYNADQMTGALATANEGVVSTLTAVGNAIVGAINRKDMSISTSDMRNAINKMNVRYGV